MAGLATKSPFHASASPVTGQKRWTAVLFADLENFTALSERHGPEKTYDLLAEIIRHCWGLIEDGRGHPIDYAGDSILAAFGAPVAVENASLDACRVALRLQAYMAASADRFQRDYGIAPKFRIGIAGGVVVVGNLGMDGKLDLSLLGESVNLASRLQRIAKAGEILCSQSVFDQVEGFADMTSLGAVAIKGFSEKKDIFRLDSLRDDQTVFQGRLHRGGEAFVARQSELARLKEWVNAAPGQAGVIDLFGPAGIGKSRLLFEACKTIEGGKHLLVANCNSSLQDKPFAPFVELVRHAAGWHPGDPREALAEAVGSLLDSAEPGLDVLVGFLGGTDELHAGSDHDAAIHIRRLMSALLVRLSSDPDNVVVFEDIHWLDPASAETLSRVIRAHGETIKVLFTRRSEFEIDWISDDSIHHWPLDPLTMDGISSMIADLLQVESLPDNLVQFVAKTTEGNSLFIEETVRYLRHTGQLRLESGAVNFEPRPEEQSTSGNLQHLILSRFDALDGAARTHLLTAATKGRQFSEGFLSCCFGDREAIRKTLDAARATGLIEPGPAALPGEWQFAHALFGKAIRQSVLESQRKEVHATIARALDTGDAAAITEHAEELAFHYLRAGVSRKAVFYLWKSAERAFAIYSVAQADQHLERAFVLMQAEPGVVDDETFAAMLVLWAKTLEIYGDFAKLNSVLLAHLPRVREAGATDALSICLTLQAMGRSFAGEYLLSVDLIQEASALAEETGDQHNIAWSKIAMMLIYLHANYWPHDRILELHREVQAALFDLGDPHLISVAHYYLASVYRARGQLQRAAEVIQELIAFGRRNSDARAISFGNNALALVCWQREDMQGLSRAAQESLRYSVPDTGAWRVAGLCQLAADHMLGVEGRQPEDFLPHAERAREFEDRPLEFGCRFQYCLSLMRGGRFHRGWQELLQLERRTEENGLLEQKLHLRLLKARILLAIAGLEPTDKSESNPRHGLRDILRILSLRPGAVRSSERILREFLARCPDSTGVTVAQVHLRLGLVARARKQLDDAKAHFELSHRLFLAEDLRTRAEQALCYATTEK